MFKGLFQKDEWKFHRVSDGEDGLLLQLRSGSSTAPVAKWTELRREAENAIYKVLSDAGDQVQVLEDGVRLQPGFVAALDQETGNALGLPPPTALGLELKPFGNIAEPQFYVSTKWVRPSGAPALVSIRGALLKIDGSEKRIPEPLWSLFNAAKSLASPLAEAERFQALSTLKSVWPEDPRDKANSDPFLEGLRIHYASALSLKLDGLTEDRTEFEPVLFSARDITDAAGDGREVDEVGDSILAPEAQALFAKDRFVRAPDARAVYLLRQGEYVAIDPSLRPALNVVRKLRDAPEKEKRAFLLNPRAKLREALGDAVADAIGIEQRFVETEQFSARVAGVDIWRTPVLPWLTPSVQNNWLPERFGLRIGETYVLIPPDKLPELVKAYEAAKQRGDRDVSLEGLIEPPEGAPNTFVPPRLPINEVASEAVAQISKFLPGAPSPAAPHESAEGPKQKPEKFFLIVRDNFNDVEYAAGGEALAPQKLVVAPLVAPPPRLRATLKPHQVEGLNWLAACKRAGRPGGLLADDMGLGKTLQAIAFMAWLQDEAKAAGLACPPFLIVAPTGLLGNWKREVTQHIDEFGLGPILPAFGGTLKQIREESGLDQRDIETGEAALKASSWQDAGVVLTTYETMRDYHLSFAKTRFGLIVFDEIQKLKNPASQVTRAAEALNGEFLLGMTGTPVENRLQDLWSIMDVIAPGYLGSSRDFERRHPPEDREALAALKSQLLDERDGRPPYMLRRLKSDALPDMPQKRVHVLRVPMPRFQADAYQDVVSRAAAAAAAGALGKGGMLTTLHQMRGVSLHPLDPRVASDDLGAYAADSARISRTLMVLDDIARKKEKALVFIEDLAMQDKLGELIHQRYRLTKPPMKINGGVPGLQRQKMVDRFQDAPGVFDVMILSPKAGGVGLTLTAANHVIHLSRWWNPAVEDQATDRVFRIGQTRQVEVYLPLAVHPDEAIGEASFDLRLHALIERKRQLTRDLFLPPEGSDGDLAGLFGDVTGAGGAVEFEPEQGDAAPQGEMGVGEAPHPYTGPEPIRVLGPEIPTVQPRAPAPNPAPPPMSRPAPTPAPTARPLPGKMLPKAAHPQIWMCKSGQERPTKEILAKFAGAFVSSVRVQDPYALGDQKARRAQISFLSDLIGVAKKVGSVAFVYNPDVRGDGDDAFRRKQFHQRFNLALSAAAPPITLITRERGSKSGDFHERFVQVEVERPGGVKETHELFLGRGLLGLYDQNAECAITYKPPG